jgi:hypothetical protein
MVFKAINDFIDFNGLISTLLVFKAYLYITKSNTPNFIVVKWAVALKNVMGLAQLQ